MPISYNLPSAQGRSSSPHQRRGCRREEPPGRCEALLLRRGEYVRCKLCVGRGSDSTLCRHHRDKNLPTAGVPRSVLRPEPYGFTLRRRGHPAIATLGNGVRVGPSRALSHLPTRPGTHLNGLYSDWHFAKRDMITLYDGACWVGRKEKIPTRDTTHVVSGQNILHPILGLMKPARGRGGASFANSSRGLDAEPNCVLYVNERRPVPYAVDPRCLASLRNPARLRDDASGAHVVLNALVVLVARKPIAPGDELLFDYRVTM